MLVHQLLEQSARDFRDSVAVIEPHRAASYSELDELANRFANVLVRAGVRRGDRVLIALDNCIELVAMYFGAMKAGGVAVPLPAGPRSDRLAHALRDCAPAVCVVDPGTLPEIGTRDPETHLRVFVSRSGHSHGGPLGTGATAVLEDELATASSAPCRVRGIDLDLAAIIYTSGSTGEPRGVMLRHRNILANTRSIVRYLRLTSRDRVMCVLPFYYVYGLSLLHTHVAVGGSIVIDNRFAFPNVVLDGMRQHHVTGFAGVPSTFALLLHRSKLDEIELPELRYVTQAGGGMPAARILEWLERGPKVPFVVMYGATEASARLTYLEPSDLRTKLGSIGRAIPNVEIQVVTDEGTIAEPGETGELVARGSNMSCGYWNDERETSAKFDAFGYRTGDLGYADTDGYLYLVGRKHDMIKVGAHRVGAKEIEDVLHGHPAVHDAAVVAAPDEILGEVPVAFVALRDDLADACEALRLFCASKLPPHKVPARWVVQPDLPKIAGTGKIDKRTLREHAVAYQERVVAANCEKAL